MICMHLYLFWNISPHFFLVFSLLDWWGLATSDLGHLCRLASSPLKLAHVSIFPDLFVQLSLCGAHRDPLICWRFLTRQIIWEDLFITPRFTSRNIRCHLLKGSSYFCKPKCPLCLVIENIPLFSFLEEKIQCCPLVLVIAPKCTLPATQKNNGFKRPFSHFSFCSFWWRNMGLEWILKSWSCILKTKIISIWI